MAPAAAPQGRSRGHCGCMAAAGDCAICGWRFGTIGEFRPLQRAGILRLARRDRGRCPLDPYDFLLWGVPPPCVCGGRRSFCAMAAVRFLAIHTVCLQNHTLP